MSLILCLLHVNIREYYPSIRFSLNLLDIIIMISLMRFLYDSTFYEFSLKTWNLRLVMMTRIIIIEKRQVWTEIWLLWNSLVMIENINTALLSSVKSKVTVFLLIIYCTTNYYYGVDEFHLFWFCPLCLYYYGGYLV